MRLVVHLTYVLALAISPLVSIQAAASRCEVLFHDSRLRSDLIDLIPAPENGTGFIVPNEKNIGSAQTVFATAADGIYVTVGSERGFMSAAMSGRTTKGLILIDHDPNVVLFNLVNRSLLELAENRGEYTRLRLRSSFAEVSVRAKNQASLSAETREVLSNSNYWNWWTTNVQSLKAWDDFHSPTQRNFKDANYLFDDQLFSTVSTLAKQRRIYIFDSNLKSDVLLSRLRETTLALNLRISVFDFSNAWDYIGLPATLELVKSLNGMTTPETFFVFTYLAASPNPLEPNSVFKYWSVRDQQVRKDGELGFMLGALRRIDPSRSAGPIRSPMNRFDQDP